MAPLFDTALAAAGLARGAPARLLFTTEPMAEPAMEAARQFAATAQPGAVIVHLLPSADGSWEAAREAAVLWAWTRHAALLWAPRDIRVNALVLGGVPPALPDQPREQAGRAASPVAAAPATVEDVARSLAAFVQLNSMTGQMIRLGAMAWSPG